MHLFHRFTSITWVSTCAWPPPPRRRRRRFDQFRRRPVACQCEGDGAGRAAAAVARGPRHPGFIETTALQHHRSTAHDCAVGRVGPRSRGGPGDSAGPGSIRDAVLLERGGRAGRPSPQLRACASHGPSSERPLPGSLQ